MDTGPLTDFRRSLERHVLYRRRAVAALQLLGSHVSKLRRTKPAGRDSWGYWQETWQARADLLLESRRVASGGFPTDAPCPMSQDAQGEETS